MKFLGFISYQKINYTTNFFFSEILEELDVENSSDYVLMND